MASWFNGASLYHVINMLYLLGRTWMKHGGLLQWSLQTQRWRLPEPGWTEITKPPLGMVQTKTYPRPQGPRATCLWYSLTIYWVNFGCFELSSNVDRSTQCHGFWSVHMLQFTFNLVISVVFSLAKVGVSDPGIFIGKARPKQSTRSKPRNPQMQRPATTSASPCLDKC